jgi:hypothetical protein
MLDIGGGTITASHLSRFLLSYPLQLLLYVSELVACRLSSSSSLGSESSQTSPDLIDLSDEDMFLLLLL